ncbi:germination protein YpeB [Texcoconibacillus texcoconensis]|uniref:Spore germination protein n=1 Tax=Texcoconibacillus texcoconensis TaxID=1095777 RepID=A0A840QNG3_9BACI|nr:germination protein YpeB [Texcoconibacillus texcoconensis]MBB5172914.1 spore germination protein [Texcoconibacillus texcoconensis]
MFRNITIVVLVIALIGTGYWGFTEQQQKQAAEIQNENNYQRAFHDLTYHVDQLNDEIGSTLAMNSTKQLSPSLAEVWRVSSQAHDEVGQLPLGLVPFNDTEKFLNDIGDFAYQNAVRDFDKEPLTDEEYETLENLYKQSEEIQEDMRHVQAHVLKGHQRWTDVERDLVNHDEPMDNTVINGFAAIDEKADSFSKTDFASGDIDILPNDEKVAEKLEGDPLSEQEAKEKVKEFLDISGEVDIVIEPTGDGLPYPAYSMTVEDPEREGPIYLDMTKQEGHPIWMLHEREIEEEHVSLNEATNNAQEFLQRNGYGNLVLDDSKQYGNVATLKFVDTQEDIRIYPDSIVLEVALDDGEVIGYESIAYLANHEDRDDLDVEISEDEAKDALNPNLDVMEHHLALLQNDVQEEVVCHEFYGTINDDTFRIFINAKNGDEERVEKLDQAEPVYEELT